MGSAFGPYGTAIGAAAGFVVGLFGGDDNKVQAQNNGGGGDSFDRLMMMLAELDDQTQDPDQLAGLGGDSDQTQNYRDYA